MSNVEHIHVIYNPEATCVKDPTKRSRVMAKLRELRESPFGSRLSREDNFIETSKDPAETAKKIDDNVDEHDVLLEVGGDGTVFIVTNALHKYAQSPHARNIRRLKIGGGYADDGAVQLNTPKQMQRPSAILAADNVIAYHPMEWRFQTADSDELVYADFYGTVGGSAAGAIALNVPANRAFTGDNKLKKGWITYRAMEAASLFKVQLPDEDEPHTTFDLGFGNGTRMAEFDGCFPYDLTDSRIFQYEFREKHVLRSAVRFPFRRVHGQTMAEPFTFTLPQPTPVQLNGEASLTEPDTTVTVVRSATPSYAYSLLLNQNTQEY